jgi:hypothetical protein
MTGSPELDWVLRELASLSAHGLAPVLFGGWAKELLAAWPGGPHDDLDVLVRARQIDELDAFILARGGQPFAPKRHPHKRAYVVSGILVELFLVTADRDDLVTDFYGRYRRVWTAPISRPLVVAGRRIELATPDTIVAYERDHRYVQDALFATQPGLRAAIAGSYGSDYLQCRHPFPTPR